MDPYVLVFSHKHPSCSGQSLFSVQLASIRYITPYVSLFWRSVSRSLQQASLGSLRGLIRPTLLFIARIPIIIFFFSLPSDQLHRFNDGHSRGRFIFQLGGGAGTHKTTQEENGTKNGRQRRERGLCNASTGRRDKEKAKQIQESGAQRKKARRGKKKKGLLEETYGVKERWMAPCSSSMAPSKSPHEDMGSDA